MGPAHSSNLTRQRLIDLPADPVRGHSLANALLALVAGLMCVGIVIVYSAEQRLDRSLEPTSLSMMLSNQALRQMVFAPLALVVMVLVSHVPYRLWRGGRQPLIGLPGMLLAVATAGLLLVFVPGLGETKFGATRWILLPGGLRIQPSELAKVALVIVMAAMLAHPAINIRSFSRGLLPVLAPVALLCGLVGIEDLGTAVLMAVVAGGMLLVAGAVWWHLVLPALIAAAGFAALIIAEPYRMNRLTGFMDIWADPQGKGFHPIQSLITLSEGGVWGEGLGGSVQKLGYLPASKTDFIFSVLTSETGLIGAAIVLLMFVAFTWMGLLIFRRAPDRLGRLLALGVTLCISLQACMNIAVVTVSAPTKGISLPLVSAGGSGVVLLAMAIGTLAAVARAGQPPLPAPASRRTDPA